MESENVTYKNESTDPHVSSSDPILRKLARQTRISKRNDATRRGTQTGDIQVTEELTRTQLELQVERSAEELERLLLEGRELVTNVRVASDTREVKRRQEETESLKRRLERLDEEAKASNEMFEEISQKWSTMTQQSAPMELKAEIDAQKEKCSKLMEHKNEVIKGLMAELEAADIRFVKDQQHQLKEVSLLVERIETQVRVMQEAYRRELQLIEDAVNIERRELLDSCNKQWDSLYKQRDKEEISMLKLQFQEKEDQDDEVKSVRTEHREKFWQTKIKLDADIQMMQQEMERVKALCLLNSEKLDYNYQVLQKREDENVMMRAQQKRRINKLQDTANSLRKRMRDSEAAAELEAARLRDEIARLNRNLSDIQYKADHFAQVNDRRYHSVWELHQQAADTLICKILTIDRLIHEQQLGIEWTPPKSNLLSKDDLPSFRTAMSLVNRIFTSNEENVYDEKNQAATSVDKEEEIGNETTRIKEIAKKRLLKLVLQKVADNAGFLVEKRLEELLAPYSYPQRTVIKLDNVFNALGLRYESDIEMLKDYFIPYATCTICSTRTDQQSENIIGEDSQSVLKSVHSDKKSDESVVSVEKKHSGLQALKRKISGKVGMLPQNPTPPDKICCEQHPLEINSVYVLQALRNFVSKFQHNELSDLKSLTFMLAQKRNTISRLLTTEDVSKFWNQYRQAFPTKSERLWDGFLLALNKYHTILSERHKLNCETKALKQQNAELKRLLNSYLQTTETAENERSELPPLNLVKM